MAGALRTTPRATTASSALWAGRPSAGGRRAMIEESRCLDDRGGSAVSAGADRGRGAGATGAILQRHACSTSTDFLGLSSARLRASALPTRSLRATSGNWRELRCGGRPLRRNINAVRLPLTWPACRLRRSSPCDLGIAFHSDGDRVMMRRPYRCGRGWRANCFSSRACCTASGRRVVWSHQRLRLRPAGGARRFPGGLPGRLRGPLERLPQGRQLFGAAA